jgi:hypothetical protein
MALLSNDPPPGTSEHHTHLIKEAIEALMVIKSNDAMTETMTVTQLTDGDGLSLDVAIFTVTDPTDGILVPMCIMISGNDDLFQRIKAPKDGALSAELLGTLTVEDGKTTFSQPGGHRHEAIIVEAAPDTVAEAEAILRKAAGE